MKERDAYVLENDGVQVIILYPYDKFSGTEAMNRAIEAIKEAKK